MAHVTSPLNRIINYTILRIYDLNFAGLCNGEPAEFEIEETSDGKELLVACRRNLTVVWLFLLGIPYDENRRVSVCALLLDPEPWKGPLPE